MSQPKEKETNVPPADKGGLTAGGLRDMIRQEITSIADTLFKGGKPTDGATPPAEGGTQTQQQQSADVKGEVARALQSLRAKEDRDARDAKLDELLAAHEAAKKSPEKAPVEQRRVHKIMGWGE